MPESRNSHDCRIPLGDRETLIKFKNETSTIRHKPSSINFRASPLCTIEVWKRIELDAIGYDDQQSETQKRIWKVYDK